MSVAKLPAATTYTVEQALNDAKQMGLEDVLILGYDVDGALVVRSSRMTKERAMFLIKLGELHTLGEVR